MSMYYSQMLPELSGSNVNADEAFSRALGAMYWGGYWTAMYHVSLGLLTWKLLVLTMECRRRDELRKLVR